MKEDPRINVFSTKQGEIPSLLSDIDSSLKSLTNIVDRLYDKLSSALSQPSEPRMGKDTRTGSCDLSKNLIDKQNTLEAAIENIEDIMDRLEL